MAREITSKEGTSVGGEANNGRRHDGTADVTEITDTNIPCKYSMHQTRSKNNAVE
jgi:hypothetical protein